MTSLPSPPLLFIAFSTPHRSPLSERLEQAKIKTNSIYIARKCPGPSFLNLMDSFKKKRTILKDSIGVYFEPFQDKQEPGSVIYMKVGVALVYTAEKDGIYSTYDPLTIKEIPET